MVTLHDLSLAHCDSLEFVCRIYEHSFPADEQRDFEAVKQLIESNPDFHLIRVDRDSTPVGFLSYWKWENIVYAEHFAIDDTCRGGGIGADALRQMIASIAPLPMVIEVEKPEDDLSRRRIAFYQRLGFKLWDNHPYIQPAYSPEKNALPMFLMTYGDVDLDISFEAVRDQIHTLVYQVQK